ncbi:MAG TPA: hypothetical protein VD994_02225, partial [Prosthecobacter sp.]|nr:hypothetical protein [Prosthecobacter sp.]
MSSIRTPTAPLSIAHCSTVTFAPPRLPSPTASPSPSPTPGATPSPTPFLNEIEAELVGAPINGITPRGEADFKVEFDGLEFRVRIEDINLPAGTQLRILVDGQFVGNISVAGGLDRSELRLKTEDGQTVPQINPRTRVVIATAAGVTVVAGSFGPNVPSPGPAPMPTPDASGRLR